MSSKRATVQISYYQNKHHSLKIDAKISQHMADMLAVRYLELLDIEQQKQRRNVTGTPHAN